jgi:hypothetical protein
MHGHMVQWKQIQCTCEIRIDEVPIYFAKPCIPWQDQHHLGKDMDISSRLEQTRKGKKVTLYHMERWKRMSRWTKTCPSIMCKSDFASIVSQAL